MQEINMLQIKIFITAAKTLNFTEAANLLYLSQPVVSKWIAKLEKSLGVKLFTRGKYGVSLTRTGSLLYADWEKLYQSFSDSLEKAGIKSGEEAHSLRIGTLMTVRYDPMILGAIEKFSAKFPQINLIQESYEYKDLRERLLSGELDAVFTYSFDVTDLHGVSHLKGISCKKLRRTEMVLAVKSDAYPLYDPREGLRFFENETFFMISPAESRRGYEQTMAVCRAAGFVPERIKLVSNIPSMEVAVRQGRGVAICDAFMGRAGEDIRLIPIDPSFSDNYLAVAWRTDDISGPLTDFLELLSPEG